MLLHMPAYAHAYAMLQVIEGEMGDGQKVEVGLADAVGIAVRSIDVSDIKALLSDYKAYDVQVQAKLDAANGMHGLALCVR